MDFYLGIAIDYPWHELLAPANVPTWILVGVGIWAACLAIGSLKVLKDQTEAAKEAASFALLNAQAVINAERAWIIVRATSYKPNVYTFIAENVGQTPAKFVSNFADIEVLGHTSQPPSAPNYRTQQIEGTIPVLCLPKDQRRVFEISTDDILRVKYPRGDAPPNHLEFMEVYFFGKIVYEDTLNTGRTPESNPVHETKWCFKLIPIEGALPVCHPFFCPPEYMGYT